MSRYQQTGKKKSAIGLIITLLVLSALVIMFYRTLEPEAESEPQVIAIPLTSEVLSTEKNTALQEDDRPQRVAIDPPLQDSRVALNEFQPLALDLDSSDEMFRAGLTALSANLADWLKGKHGVRKLIVLINDLSQNQILYKNRKFLKMPQAMQVQELDAGLFIAEESYQRYDLLANTIASIDVQQAARLYLTFKPLFDQVYDEFSYPKGYRLEDIFIKAAAVIIQAPVLEKRIKVVRDSVVYKFADEELQAMNAVEKQMIRMGPDNTRKVQEKLRQLVQAILLINE